MNSPLFDVEQLQKLIYDRSKDWAGYLEELTKRETLSDIDINDLDSILTIEDEEVIHRSDSEAIEDDAGDVNLDTKILRNLSNTARLSSLFNKTLDTFDDIKDVGEKRLIDIFNQTLTVINEHNRQLKEYGLDKILHSFDKKKIETEVGGWLNRHNSLYGGDNTLLYGNNKNKNCKVKGQIMSNFAVESDRSNRLVRKYVNNDSDDSLQSGETARYIRSSKASANKTSASRTTLIKTYRMAKSTREALREKYACENEDCDYSLKLTRHRKKISHDIRYLRDQYEMTRFHKSRKCDMTPLSSLNQRRKVLRKRACSNSFSTLDSTSESDCCYEDYRISQRKNVKSCYQYHRCAAKHKCCVSKTVTPCTIKSLKTTRSAVKISSVRNKPFYCPRSRSKSSMSSSSSSFTSASENRTAIKRDDKFCTDNRPCKRESECYCCNEKDLCDEFKHIANSSTESWHVENYYSPEEHPKTTTRAKKLTNALTSSNEMLLEDKTIVKTEDLCQKKQSINDKKTTSKSSTKNKSKLSKTKRTLKNASPSESSDEELKISLQSLKELYKKEQPTKNEKLEKEIKSCEILPTKPLKDVEEAEECERETGSIHTKRKKTATKNKVAANTEIEIIEKQPRLSQNESIKLSTETFVKESDLINSIPSKNSEETFFAAIQTQGICNSTALSSQTQAYNRQINYQLAIHPEQKKEISKNETKIDLKKSSSAKQTKAKNSKIKAKNKSKSNCSDSKERNQKDAVSNSVTSTSMRARDLSSTLTEIERSNEMIFDDNSDCLVTSTTNIESQFSTTVIDKNDKNNTTSSGSQKFATNDVLIYTPTNRSMASAANFTSNGYFTVTKQHLSSFIGEKFAEKFLKYYVGRRRFRSNSTIYYRPPSKAALDGNREFSSSDSDDDLDNLGQYGDLYAIDK